MTTDLVFVMEKAHRAKLTELFRQVDMPPIEIPGHS
jgi:predicted protein tyrosine phosphatase